MAEEDKPKEKSLAYTEEQFKLDMTRLKKVPTEKDRMVIVRAIANNYLLTGKHAAAFVHEMRDWPNMTAIAALLMYNLKEGETEEYTNLVIKGCKYEDDKKQIALFLDTEYVPEKTKEEPEGPTVNEYDERNDRFYRM
mmetsp:Transcript_8235/g.10423  ORF Transcript_8235/g.10423 Transcript_8235/m.10423 type:complete len:138 (+) Transcript_8235:212-625(+)|eukprot:CAMPEP_0204839432 /NCGR_PEP_ID=MMETSP1346-20131115/34262_1 /ASSEMBLY_ACC=CAM_ASM_000771 /TAXON_ID=215587 /ORGANISM="Aplanochytrium stocchinoi, Strain GSBS06" /LENGTH=137 /DNA_ID=CAMNT_0051976163 /DNA_START=180 /DNA_END=593 /DNA_ORIENTATION=-